MIRLFVTVVVFVVSFILAGWWIYQETRPPGDRWVPTPGQRRVAKLLAIMVSIMIVAAAFGLALAFVDLL